MLQPSLDSLKREKPGTLVPVYKEILADLETPVSVFLKIMRNEQNAIFLESVELGEKLGRYSFILFGSNKILSSHGNVLDVIEKEMEEKRRRFKRSPDLPSFQGGYVGYLAYENVRHFETIQLNPDKKGLGLPESVFFWVDRFIVFDHVDQKMRIVVLVECGPALEKNYAQAVREIEEVETKISEGTTLRRKVSRNHDF